MTLDLVSAHNQSAVDCLARGDFAGALQHLEQAVHLQPQNPVLVCNYAQVLADMGEVGRAETILRAVLSAVPEQLDALVRLARLLQQRAPEEGAQLLARAVNVPRRTEFEACMLAEALLAAGALQTAEHVLRPWCDTEVGTPAMSLLAQALCLQNRAPEAVSLFAEGREPADLAGCLAWVRALRDQGEEFAALAAVDRAMIRFGDVPALRWSRGVLRLATGDWSSGWEDFEARWQVPGVAQGLLPTPEDRRWNGEVLPDKTLLIWEEQGFGDTLQCLRYLSHVQGRVGRLVVLVRPPLRRLVAASFPAVEVVEVLDGISWDVQLPTMSLPRICWNSCGFAADRTPYLSVPPEVAATWSSRLSRGGGPCVGVVWSGGKTPGDLVRSAMDARRSIDPGLLHAAIRHLPVRWVAVCKDGNDAAPWAENFSDVLKDYLDTAGLISQLDAVVAVDTSVAHLAGALGKPVYLLNRIGGCWRWGTQGATTPWYPTMRLLRQHAYRDWTGVLTELSAMLMPAGSGR